MKIVGGKWSNWSGGVSCKPRKIERIGHHGRFVEIVYAPDEPRLGVAPGAEVLEMNVPHRENRGSTP